MALPTPTPPEGYTRTHIKWDTPTPGWMEFDAILNRSVNHEGEVTDHPVDSTANISDHYRTLPVPINIETIITNSPLSLPRTHTGGAREVQEEDELVLSKPIFPGAPTSVGGFDIASKNLVTIRTKNYSPEMTRVDAIYQELLLIQKEARLLSLFLSNDWNGGTQEGDNGYYDNILLVSFNMSQEPGLGGAARLSMDFRRVNIANVRFDPVIVEAKPPAPSKPRSNRAKDAGKKATKDKVNDKATEERSKSAALRSLNAFGINL